MAELKDFLPSSFNGTAMPTMSIPQPGVVKPGSNIIALALVDAGTLPDINSSATFTPPGGGTAAAITALNLVGMLKLLALAGKCTFFLDRSINGSKKDPDEFESDEAWGTEIDKMPTGEVKEAAEIKFKHAFLNVEWLNALRANGRFYDCYIFVPGGVIVVRYSRNSVIFKKVKGVVIDGDVTKEMTGGFSIMWRSMGEIPPVLGVLASDLAGPVQYTFAAPATVTGVALVVGSVNPYRFTVTGAVAGGFILAVSDTAAQGLITYLLYKNVKDAVGTDPVAINSVTGAVTIGATQPVGTNLYTVVAQGPSGVIGFAQFQIVKS